MTSVHVTSDRAAGVLLGLACGDALGVRYEFDHVMLGPDESPAMLGGGPGDLERGEWSDDTSMAVGVAEGLAGGVTLDEQLEAIARRFLDWFDTSPPDVGIQTRAVLAGVAGLAEARRADLAPAMRAAAADYALRHPHAAGNGALMRTAPVALAYPADRAACADAARAIATLTHADPDVADTCVLWTEAVRVALTGGGIDLMAGLDLVADTDRWREVLDEAVSGDLARLRPNGWTVRTLQVAYGAIHQAGHDLEHALTLAIRVGDDTDTVAAVAGSLLGAHYGASALPAAWVEAVHGWPGHRAEELRRLALRLVEMPGRRGPLGE